MPYSLLRYLPKNWLSFLFGLLASVPLPVFMRSVLFNWYSRKYGVEVSEAELEPTQYSSLADFFKRKLREGVRPCGEGVVSPTDGKIQEYGRIVEGNLLQVKGREFSVSDLLCDQVLGQKFEDGYGVTIYLAPGDYHRIHSPVAGDIVQSTHIEGALWPVNTWSVHAIDGLFVTNERIVTYIKTEKGLVAVVKVGATNVGSISLSYDNVRANTFTRLFSGGKGVHVKHYEPAIPCEKGGELGIFELGSTVVVLFESGTFTPGEMCRIGPVHLGQSIGS